jgi:hypothetical protein
MVKKLKDVNGDGKRNFKDTWLGEKLLGGGKTKGPNLKESMAGARRESSPAPTKADAPKAKTTTKTTSNSTAKTTATKATPKPKAKPLTSSPSPKSKPMQSSAKPKTNPRNMPPKVDSTPPTMISPKPTPIVTGVVGGSRKASMSGNLGAGASAKATVAAKKPDAMGAKIRGVLTKGYLPGSAADTRAKKSAQWYKAVDQAQVDMRMQRAADEEKRARRRGK